MLNLITPINNLGYGIAGYNIFVELLKLDPSVALYPIQKPEFFNDIIVAGMNNRENANNHPSVKIWHQNDVHSHVGKGKHIGFPIFELTEFTYEEKLSMKHCDELIVCSKWARDIVRSQTDAYANGGFLLDQIHVVPLGVDTNLFKPQNSGRHQTVFFNCGKWEKRKGHDILLECFNAAFKESDNVELWMMCDNPFIGSMNEQWKNLYKNSPLGDKIRIIPRQRTHADVYNIMRQTDCGVFPARAEGWNLELLEMMACGKSVIATDYSAHTEFCNKDNCYLVDIDELETAYDGVFFSGSHGEWASFSQPQKDQLIEHFRAVHKSKQQNGSSSNMAGIETAKSFSWNNSAKELLNGLKL